MSASRRNLEYAIGRVLSPYWVILHNGRAQYEGSKIAWN